MNTATLACALALAFVSTASALTVDADFEGASVKVLGIDEASQTITFSPGGDAARGWPCWWCFRVSGLTPGQRLTLVLRPSGALIPQAGGYFQKPLPLEWAAPEQATVSLDGKKWVHAGAGHRATGGMVYEIQPEAASVLVAWGPPYAPERARAFVQEVASRFAWAQEMNLCVSHEGRKVPLLRISEGDRVEARRFGIWVEARQHAWESGGSWVCQGFADWLSGDDAEAQWLRQNAEIFVVPVMDVDHCATGDGGKEALPQDHNRDWTDHPHWAEVAAAQRALADLAKEERLDIFLDLHNPAPKDAEAFFFAPPPQLMRGAMAANQEKFLSLAVREIAGVMPVMRAPKISGPLYHPLWKQISGNWVAAHGTEQTVALCLETPWNTPRGTTEGYRAVGAALGRAMERYLEGRGQP